MDFNHYFKNEELEQILHTWAEQYPALVKLSELGRSYEDRPIWLLTLTTQASGADTEKPAMWIDANIHATELAGTTTALRIVQTLLDGYGKDPRITRQLDYHTYYIVPRANPDGAALALQAVPRAVRSGVRFYPWGERQPGLHEEDIDGDGRILTMRLLDPNGDWKVSELDPRLMQKRRPDEHGGVYYRLLPEGRILDFDGYRITTAPRPEGLDFNRNFPFEWRTEGQQHGAGDYPASEPEVRAMVDFVARHRNINIAVTYHTFSRVILRPYSTKSDDEMEVSDLWVFKTIGEIGSGITGYRSVSTFHDFKYHPKEVTSGAFDDYLYDHFGAYAFTIELWDLPNEAGLKDRKFIEWYRIHPHEEDLQILKWADEHAPSGYVPWYPVKHPQLGQIELGGWDLMYTWRNPPPSLMAAEAERNVPFALALCDLLPRLSLFAFEALPLGDGKYHINLVVDNTGYLPTCTSEQGKKRKAVRPVRAQLELPAGAEVINGRAQVELGHLEGRSNKFDVIPVWAEGDTDHRGRAVWTIRGQPGSTVSVTVSSERAGTLHGSIRLP
ncbi:MAG: M14 family metallopeptidase [Chloroflexota bacterium]